jgi:hypothetical protein
MSHNSSVGKPLPKILVSIAKWMYMDNNWLSAWLKLSGITITIALSAWGIGYLIGIPNSWAIPAIIFFLFIITFAIGRKKMKLKTIQRGVVALGEDRIEITKPVFDQFGSRIYNEHGELVYSNHHIEVGEGSPPNFFGMFHVVESEIVTAEVFDALSEIIEDVTLRGNEYVIPKAQLLALCKIEDSTLFAEMADGLDKFKKIIGANIATMFRQKLENLYWDKPTNSNNQDYLAGRAGTILGLLEKDPEMLEIFSKFGVRLIDLRYITAPSLSKKMLEAMEAKKIAEWKAKGVSINSAAIRTAIEKFMSEHGKKYNATYSDAMIAVMYSNPNGPNMSWLQPGMNEATMPKDFLKAKILTEAGK